jgi:excisionase family DNA binding protein
MSNRKPDALEGLTYTTRTTVAAESPVPISPVVATMLEVTTKTADLGRALVREQRAVVELVNEVAKEAADSRSGLTRALTATAEAVSVEAAAALLGCRRRQVFSLLKRGVLVRAPRVGRELRIYVASINEALRPRAEKRRKRRLPMPEKFDLADIRL